jgi:hypothetical protein
LTVETDPLELLKQFQRRKFANILPEEADAVAWAIEHVEKVRRCEAAMAEIDRHSKESIHEMLDGLRKGNG